MNTRKFNPWFKTIASVVILTFTATSIIPPSRAYAQSMPGGMMTLPAPGALLNLSPAHTPALLTGIQLNLDNPFQFEFLVQKSDDQLTAEQKQQEYSRLIKYFLTVLTVPEKELWVNLSPYEKNRIVSDDLGKTEMGRDLLALDYILKQLSASLMHPEGEAGKKFWKRIYAKAQEKFGTTEIPVNTFNRVWIVPQTAVVFERNNTALVVESRLKVLLEEDLIALDKQLGTDTEHTKFAADSKQFAEIEQENKKDVNKLSSAIVREVILPEIEKEVNEGKSFAQLRQIYNAMILAVWFKKRLKTSVFGEMYLDKKKMDGISLNDNSYKQDIYNQYVEAYKKGAYDLIREEYDTASEEMIPRKYFSGGVNLNMAMMSGRDSVYRLLREEDGLDESVRAALSKIVARGIEAVTVDTNLVPDFEVQSVVQGNVIVDQNELEALRTLSGKLAATTINKRVEALIAAGADVRKIHRLENLLLTFIANNREEELKTEYFLKPEYLAALQENVRWLGAIQEVDRETQRVIQKAAAKDQSVLRAVAAEANRLVLDRPRLLVLEREGLTVLGVVTKASALLAKNDPWLQEVMAAPTEAKRRDVVAGMIRQVPIEEREKLYPVFTDMWSTPLLMAAAVVLVCLFASSMENRGFKSSLSGRGLFSYQETKVLQAPQTPGSNLGFIDSLILLDNVEDLEFKGARDRLEKAQAELRKVQERLQDASKKFEKALDEVLTRPDSAELREKSAKAQKEFYEAKLAVRQAEKEENEAEIALLTAEQNRQQDIVLKIGRGLGLTSNELEKAMADWRNQKRERSTFGNKDLDEALKQIGEAEVAIEAAKIAVAKAEAAIDVLNIELGKTPNKVVQRETQYLLPFGLDWTVLNIDPTKTLAQNITDYMLDRGPFLADRNYVTNYLITEIMRDNGLSEGDPMPQEIFMRPVAIEHGLYGASLDKGFAYLGEIQRVNIPPIEDVIRQQLIDTMFDRLAEQKLALGNSGIFKDTRIVTKDGTLDTERPLKWVPVEVKRGQSIQDVVQSYFRRPIDGLADGEAFGSVEDIARQILADNGIQDFIPAPDALPKVIWVRPIRRVYSAERMRFVLSRMHDYLHDPRKTGDGGEYYFDQLLIQKNLYNETGVLGTSVEEQEKAPDRNRAMLLEDIGAAFVAMDKLRGDLPKFAEKGAIDASVSVGDISSRLTALGELLLSFREIAKKPQWRLVEIRGIDALEEALRKAIADTFFLFRTNEDSVQESVLDFRRALRQVRRSILNLTFREEVTWEEASRVVETLKGPSKVEIEISPQTLIRVKLYLEVPRPQISGQDAQDAINLINLRLESFFGAGDMEKEFRQAAGNRAMMNQSPGGIALDSQYLDMQFEGDPIVLKTPEEMQWIDMNAISGLSITGFKVQSVANPWSLPIFSGMQIK